MQDYGQQYLAARVNKSCDRLTKRVLARHDWMLKHVQSTVDVLPAIVLEWNPQYTMVDTWPPTNEDLDWAVIHNMVNTKTVSMIHHPNLPNESTDEKYSSPLLSSCLGAASSTSDIQLFGWCMMRHDDSNITTNDAIECVVVSSCEFKTMRGAARLVTNTLAARYNSTIPEFVALYNPAMTRLTCYRIDGKFLGSASLANEANLTSVGPKISRVSIQQAIASIVQLV